MAQIGANNDLYLYPPFDSIAFFWEKWVQEWRGKAQSSINLGKTSNCLSI